MRLTNNTKGQDEANKSTIQESTKSPSPTDIKQDLNLTAPLQDKNIKQKQNDLITQIN